MPSKYKVFVTRRIPEAGLALLRARKDIALTVYAKDKVIPRSDLLAGIRGADAVLSLLTDKIDEAALKTAGSQLKIVSNYAVGFDNIDLAACKARNVKIANTPGVLSNAVAEHTFALMMSIARRIPESDDFMRSGRYRGWEPMLLVGSGIQGKTLGVIGLGRIGKGVVDRAAKGMGMKIMYYDLKRDKAFEQAEPGTRYASIDRIVSDADFISIHVPLLPSTRHLIDARRLKMMKKTAYLINTSRGPIIDEKALVGALRKGQIAGAALDVFENEPKLAPGLAKLKNVVLTPHTASATIEARDDMATMAAQAIIAVLDGKTPVNLVKA
jgi:glyoxylate reductase